MSEYSEFVYRTIIDYQPEERESIVNLDHYGTIHERIVRCRDCEHFTLEGSYRFEDGSTNVDFCEYVRGWLLQVTPDGFCAWGERKVDE